MAINLLYLKGLRHFGYGMPIAQGLAPMSHSDSPGSQAAIAARIRGLIGGQDQGLIEATARRLDVSEVSLRVSLDEIQPHPTLEVIVAVIAHYGVDPSWLVSGEYDGATHRKALDEEASRSRDEVAKLVAARIASAEAAAAGAIRPSLRLEA
jgi:hypothetical protein